MVLSALVALFGATLSLPLVSDLLSLASVRKGNAPRRPDGRPSRLVFLVPAYDEEMLIGDCVRSLAAMLYPRDHFSIIVIADNCTDRTAERAVAAGATCLVRNDPLHRGKPYAIAWAIPQLPPDADAMVIVDADTVVDPMFAAEIARLAPLGGKAVQVRNGVSNPDESAITRMSTVLASAKFEFSLPVKRRAGLNVPMGAGSCIGTGILARYGWRAFSIGEDWEMYALLTIEGVEIDLAPRARLYAQEARSLKQVSSQRKRWAAGRLAVLSQYWRAILRSRAIGPRQKLDTISELLAPGPVVHLGAVTVVSAVALAAGGVAPWALALCWLSLARPGAYCIAGLLAAPDPLRTVRAFLYLPVYATWRLWVEVTALLSVGEKTWVRTGRNAPR